MADSSSSPKKKSWLGLIILLGVIIIISIVFIFQLANSYKKAKSSAYSVTIEVEQIYPVGEYKKAKVTENLTKPVMKGKVISINKTAYQEAHPSSDEPNIGDEYFFTEINGESIPLASEVELTIQHDEIVSDEYEQYFGNIDLMEYEEK